MGDAVLIERFSERELRELLAEIVQRETDELRKEVSALREELRQRRPVITAREATHYFDSRVTPATIIDYIWYQGLPAFKNGRTWFIYVSDLLDWQIGLIGHQSTKRQGTKSLVTPRYRAGRASKTHSDGDRPGRQRHDETAHLLASKEAALKESSV